MIAAVFALAKIGAVVVPINTRFRTSDLEYVLWQSDSTTLITVDRSGPVDYLDMVRQVCPDTASTDPDHLHAEKFPQLRRVVVLGECPGPGMHRWEEVMAGAASAPPAAWKHRYRQVDPDATVLTLYTSGTTGFPKGVMHGHNIQRTVIDAGSRMGITPRDVILMYLPLFHVFGLYEGLLMFVATGARMVLTTLFDPAEVLRLIAPERATILNGFDTHFHAPTTHPDCEKTDRSSLRTGLFATGMASSEPAARRTQRLLCPTVTAWGMTEIGCGVTRSSLDFPEDDRCLASGCALPGYACKVVDQPTGATVSCGTMGELCVRRYSLMQGYYKKEVPCACFIPKQGKEVSHEALVAFCRGQLASFKIPQYTVVVDGFPMTSSGKVQKFKLREMAAESLGLGHDTTAMVVLHS